MEYKLDRNCLCFKWTMTLADMGKTLIWAGKDTGSSSCTSKGTLLALPLGVLLFNLLKGKGKKRWGRGKKMKICILSAINGNHWSRIILAYFFFYLAHSLHHLETCHLWKQSESNFSHRHVACRKALMMAFLILPPKGGGRIPKWEMLTSVCFLQCKAAMERMQKSKLSLYKKTMEVSKVGVFPSMQSGSTLRLGEICVTHTYIKERPRICECARVCVWKRGADPAMRRKLN